MSQNIVSLYYES